MGQNGPQSPREVALLVQVGEDPAGVFEGGWPGGRSVQRAVVGVVGRGDELLHGRHRRR